MYDIDLIEKCSLIILCVILPGIGALGVVFHVYLESRLSFFVHEDENTSKKKKAIKRIVIPWITIASLSAIAPVAIVYSHPAVLESLESPNIYGTITSPWRYFLPVVNWEITVSVCFITGSLYFIIIGLLLRLFGKIFR